MPLIQPQKFRTLKTGCLKMPHLQIPRLQMAVFQMGITTASGLHDKMTKSQSDEKIITIVRLLEVVKVFCKLV